MSRRAQLFDAGVAVAAFALTVGMLVGEPEAAERDVDALGVGLAAIATLPLVARRRAPLGVFAVTAAASVALNALDYPLGPPLGPTVALFTLALAPGTTYQRTRLTAVTVIGLFLLHAGAAGAARSEFPTVPLLFGALVWGGAWVAGDRIRQRRERFAALEERAVRSEREAERDQRLAVAEERTRIARDLHDSAGHAINVILVQAGAARLLHQRDPARSQAALETIEEVARDTLSEIDQLVRGLREEGPGEVEPPPGLAALETLAERHRNAGLAVATNVHGRRRPLAPGIDRAAYRILQEALTNAARHGRGRADVDVGFAERALELTVANPTRREREAAAAAGGGHGLVGMRERAALLGGTLEAGASNGVFRVRAQLPYDGGERA